MKIKTKYDIKQEIWFIDLPWCSEPTCNNIGINKGVIDAISIRDKGIIKYNISSDMYYRDIPQKLIFLNKNDAEIYVFNKYFKGRK